MRLSSIAFVIVGGLFVLLGPLNDVAFVVGLGLTVLGLIRFVKGEIVSELQNHEQDLYEDEFDGVSVVFGALYLFDFCILAGSEKTSMIAAMILPALVLIFGWINAKTIRLFMENRLRANIEDITEASTTINEQMEVRIAELIQSSGTYNRTQIMQEIERLIPERGKKRKK